MISFTFDDFPASALDVGGKLLQSYGVRGTYYVAMSLEGQLWHGRAGFTKQHVKQLVGQGHELGCHTYSHADCRESTQEALRQDLALNWERCREILDDVVLSSFAYPCGLNSASAKQVIGSSFATARHIRQGLNHTVIDLCELSANELKVTFPIDQAARLIERCRQKRGWLIFFTHDVDENPSPWGCTPRSFEAVVNAALESGCSVLPVRDALKHLKTDASTIVEYSSSPRYE